MWKRSRKMDMSLVFAAASAALTISCPSTYTRGQPRRWKPPHLQLRGFAKARFITLVELGADVHDPRAVVAALPHEIDGLSCTF